MRRAWMQSLQQLVMQRPLQQGPGAMLHRATPGAGAQHPMVPGSVRRAMQCSSASSSAPALQAAGGQGGGSGSSGRGGDGSGGGWGWGSGGSGWGRAGGALGLTGLSFLAAGPAAARGKDAAKPSTPLVTLDPNSNDAAELTVEKVTEMLWKLAGPILTNLGFSGSMGLVAGIALKKVGMFLAVVVGIAFAALQALAYTGVITVNWSKVQQAITVSLDANGDGKLDEQDFKIYMNSGLGVLTTGVPSVSGFLAGFVLGLRM